MKQRSDADRRSPEGERRSPSEDEADEKVSSAEIHNAEDYKEIFQPKNAICKSTVAITPAAQTWFSLGLRFCSRSSVFQFILSF